MNEQEKILAAYLKEELPGFDISREEDRQVLILLSNTLRLERKIQDEEGNYRVVKVKEKVDGEYNVYSMRLYNVFHTDLDKQLSTIAKMVPLFSVAVLVNFAAAFLAVLASFVPLLKRKYEGQNAKILVAILKLGKKDFTESELFTELQSLGFKEITQEGMYRSLVELSNAKVLRSLGHEKYQIREKIKYVR